MLKIDKWWMRASYLLFMIGWTIGDIRYNNGDDFKYILLILSIMIGCLIITYNLWTNKEETLKKLNCYGIHRVGLVIIVFVAVSCIYMVKNGFTTIMLRYIFLMFVPMLYTFLVVNVDDSENMDFYFNAILIGQLLVFLDHFGSILDMQHIMSISFENSYSPYESTTADYWCMLFFYYYMRNKKIRCAVSAIVCCLTFKRFHLVMIVFMLLFGWLLKKINISNIIINLTKIFFIASPMMLSFLTSESFVSWFDSNFSISFQQFTMGRFGQITELAACDIPMYGVGSIDYYLVLNNYYIKTMHCDMLRFYWETTIIGLVVFVCMYFGLVRKNIYNYVLMLFWFVMMFISTCIQMYLTWFMIFMIMEINGRMEMSKNSKKKEAEG